MRMTVLGEATDTIFTEEREDAKIVSAGSILLIVHSLLSPFLFKGAAVVFSTSLKFDPQAHWAGRRM